MYFKIAGTNFSYKSSCCRGIVYIDDDKKEVSFLLVYHKGHIVKTGNETVAWKKIIVKEFPEHKALLN